MGDIKTPRSAKGSRALKILKKTSQSVYSAKLPARSAANFKHSHSLIGARQVKRIDRQDWEERIADILGVLEEHRHGRANRLYSALDMANQALSEAQKKKEEMETYMEELNAANEEMRASNEEMRANAEEMRAANEELRTISIELEQHHQDQERLAPLFEKKGVLPLMQLTSTLKNISTIIGDSIDTDLQEQLQTGTQSITELREILSGVSDYWLMEQEAETLEDIDCNGILSDLLLSMQETISKHNARITNSPMPVIHADTKSISELFTILIHNAISYHGEDSPIIHLSATRATDWPGEMPEPRIDNGWVLSVQDNGRGIEDDHIDKIFMLFENCGLEQAGLGLGLSRAMRIVRHHGGTIWVESEPGVGSTFNFSIPHFEGDMDL